MPHQAHLQKHQPAGRVSKQAAAVLGHLQIPSPKGARLIIQEHLLQAAPPLQMATKIPQAHTEPQADQNSQLDSNHKIATMPKQPIVKASLDSSSGRHLGREGESPHVLSALDRAEELARALMEPGGVTPERRKDLEAAIAGAEAAMSQVAEKSENK